MASLAQMQSPCRWLVMIDVNKPSHRAVREQSWSKARQGDVEPTWTNKNLSGPGQMGTWWTEVFQELVTCWSHDDAVKVWWFIRGFHLCLRVWCIGYQFPGAGVGVGCSQTSGSKQTLHIRESWNLQESRWPFPAVNRGNQSRRLSSPESDLLNCLPDNQRAPWSQHLSHHPSSGGLVGGLFSAAASFESS